MIQATEQQKEVLSLLTKLSNMVSNAVWIAEHPNETCGEDHVEKQIELGIWSAKHFLSEIENLTPSPRRSGDK